ncbi:MAG TPA: hypothetical protein VF530_04320 [Planctomycetota bacterium]
MKAPGEILRTARRVVLFVALALVLYGVARFDLVLLPEGARSPLYGLHAGDRLLVDRHARHGAEEETWLYRGAAGELLIGRATAPPAGLEPAARAALAAGGLWIVAERDVPGVADSRTLGPIPAEGRVGRVLLVLPW